MLNVPAAKMSSLPDDSDHLLKVSPAPSLGFLISIICGGKQFEGFLLSNVISLEIIVGISVQD